MTEISPCQGYTSFSPTSLAAAMRKSSSRAPSVSLSLGYAAMRIALETCPVDRTSFRSRPQGHRVPSRPTRVFFLDSRSAANFSITRFCLGNAVFCARSANAQPIETRTDHTCRSMEMRRRSALSNRRRPRVVALPNVRCPIAGTREPPDHFRRGSHPDTYADIHKPACAFILVPQ